MSNEPAKPLQRFRITQVLKRLTEAAGVLLIALCAFIIAYHSDSERTSQRIPSTSNIDFVQVIRYPFSGQLSDAWPAFVTASAVIAIALALGTIRQVHDRYSFKKDYCSS